jgi:prepilin-type processing-associated H-X9-DG protein
MWDFCGAPNSNRDNFMIAGYFWLAKRPGYRNGAGFQPNTLTNMPFRNPLYDRWVEKVTDKADRSTPAELVMMSDITLSNDDNRSWANKNFITIRGGYRAGHGTTHRQGDKPLGGNVSFLDGHVEWRNFDSMKNRLTGWPHFWY